MNPQGTSFIPHRPTQGNIQNRGVRKVYILTYVSYVVFFGTILAVGGVLAYKFTLNTQLVRQQQLLSEERNKFKEGDIESVKTLERRINTSKERMDKHVSVVSVFDAFEKAAVQSLHFSNIVYKRISDASVKVTVTGTADAFNGILFQRDVLLSNPVLAKATVSGVELATGSSVNDDGTPKKGDVKKTITFSIGENLDASTIKYVAHTPDASGQNQSETNAASSDVSSTTVSENP